MHHDHLYAPNPRIANTVHDFGCEIVLVFSRVQIAKMCSLESLLTTEDGVGDEDMVGLLESLPQSSSDSLPHGTLQTTLESTLPVVIDLVGSYL